MEALPLARSRIPPATQARMGFEPTTLRDLVVVSLTHSKIVCNSNWTEPVIGRVMSKFDERAVRG